MLLTPSACLRWAASRAAIIEELQLNFLLPPPFSAPFLLWELGRRMVAATLRAYGTRCAQISSATDDTDTGEDVARERRRAHQAQLRHMRAYIDAEREARGDSAEVYIPSFFRTGPLLSQTCSLLFSSHPASSSSSSTLSPFVCDSSASSSVLSICHPPRQVRMERQLEKSDQIASMLDAAERERARAYEKSQKLTAMLETTEEKLGASVRMTEELRAEVRQLARSMLGGALGAANPSRAGRAVLPTATERVQRSPLETAVPIVDESERADASPTSSQQLSQRMPSRSPRSEIADGFNAVASATTSARSRGASTRSPASGELINGQARGVRPSDAVQRAGCPRTPSAGLMGRQAAQGHCGSNHAGAGGPLALASGVKSEPSMRARGEVSDGVRALARSMLPTSPNVPTVAVTAGAPRGATPSLPSATVDGNRARLRFPADVQAGAEVPRRPRGRSQSPR